MARADLSDVHSDARDWVRVAVQAGATLENGSRHLILRLGPQPVPIARRGDRPDPRALKNLRAQLRRLGVDC